MNHRIPLIVAVVGALLVGGATTGSTRASWVDQVNLPTHAVGSGEMTRTGVAAPTSLSVTKGLTATTKVTATNSSPAAAKNLVQRITPTVSVSTTPGSATGVTASLTTTNSGGTCTGTAQGPVSTTAGQNFVFCVNVSATAGTTATAATVTVTLSGQQMRNGNPQGWNSSQTVTVPVTVLAPTPPTPVLTCVEIGSDARVSWTEVPGTTYYRSDLAERFFLVDGHRRRGFPLRRHRLALLAHLRSRQGHQCLRLVSLEQQPPHDSSRQRQDRLPVTP